MLNVLSSVVDRGFELRSGQTKDWNWYLLKAKTGLHGNSIMCENETTYLHADYYVSELEH